MHLHIDTSDRNNSYLELDGRRVQVTQGILSALEASLGGASPRKISKITVNTGPGSFTGLRVGVAFANALGYALGLLGTDSFFKPDYGKPPNITPLP